MKHAIDIRLQHAWERYRHDSRNHHAKDALAEVCWEYAKILVRTRVTPNNVDDALSYITLTIAKVIDRFDVEKYNCTFEFHLHQSIRSDIQKYKRDLKSIIHVPAWLYEVNGKILRFWNENLARHGRLPERQETIAALGIKEHHYDWAVRAYKIYDVYSTQELQESNPHFDLSCTHDNNAVIDLDVVAKDYIKVLGKQMSEKQFMALHNIAPENRKTVRKLLPEYIQQRQLCAN
jgi:DNA-directed RNA polymerase specialized sigma subunit